MMRTDWLRADRIGNRQRVGRSGFTLLEVLVVLALSAVVMLLVGSALQLHLRITDNRSNAVRNAQLARVILRQIGNDLRSVTFSDSATGGSAGATAPTTPTAPTAPTTPTTPTAPTTPTSAAAATTDPQSQTVPGLYGDAYQIRLEAVHAVETKSWFTEMDTDEPQSFDSEVALKPWGSLQSVAYFVNGSENSTGGNTSQPIMDPQMLLQDSTMERAAGGLVRQVVDHPVTVYALENGGSADLDDFSQLFAPEVISLTFRYFDGADWYGEWDSYEQEGLPVAVEVSLGLATPVDDEGDTSSFYQEFLDGDSTFTMLVHLPTSEAVNAGI